MLDRETYRQLLGAHGRRVANRAAVASAPKDQRGWTAFYACYGHERGLLEIERSRPGNPANEFDPTGWNAFYRNHPTDERSAIHHVTCGQSRYWFEQLVGAREFWGGWVIHFLHDSLGFGGESNATWYAIADDQGEFISTADGGILCAWLPGWIGWKNWRRSLSSDDLQNLLHVLGWLRGGEFTHQWPGPGTSRSAAFKVTRKVEK